MKTGWKVLISISVLFNAVSLVLAYRVVADHFRLTYPSPEMESSFIQNYTPKTVIDSFKDPGFGYGEGGGTGTGAGRNFVTHQREFDEHFTMHSDQEDALNNSLADDLSTQLTADGAQILSRTGEPGSVVVVEYKLDRSLGTVTLSPLVPDKGVRRNTPLPEGMADVIARVAITDKWFVGEKDVFEASLQNPQ